MLIGFVLQASANLAEAIRITLIQIMLQKKGIKLDPVSTLYYVAPCCFVFLIPLLCFFELGPLMKSSLDIVSLIPLLLLNSVAAFGMVASFEILFPLLTGLRIYIC